MTACATLRNAEQYKVDKVDFFLNSQIRFCPMGFKGNQASVFCGGEGDVPKAFRTTWIFDINMIKWVMVSSPFEKYAQ